MALLRSSFKKVMEAHPFIVDAIVVLPDHLHSVWTLPEGDNDFAIRWSLIKGGFTRECNGRYKGDRTASRISRNEQAVWQHRFWEHEIHDDEDFRRHVEYVHYNPVKHGYVERPAAWGFSSFGRYLREGLYPVDWGAGGIRFPDSVGKE
jgi:putative transposase